MQHELQVALTKDIFRHIDNKTTDMAPDMVRNPIDAYRDSDRLKQELKQLFRGLPNFMGLSCRLLNPGDYVTEDFAGVPVLLARTMQGELKGFFNICRHRGTKVAKGCGNSRKGFVCPYHAWTYNLAGELVGVPHADSFPGLDKAQNGLVELPTVERDGLIWVSANRDAELDVDAHLNGLAPELASYGFGAYHHYETRELTFKMNWKAAIDTFLEPYHFAYLHANTVGPIFIPNLCLFEGFGPNLREIMPRRTISELRQQPESDWDLVRHSAVVYVLFPNTVFIMLADHLETWRVYPVGDKADECIMYLDFYTPEAVTTESARQHWERSMDLTIRTVQEEDFPAVESIQFGLASGAQDALTYGRNEPALIHFERSVTEAIGA